jgi:preprotein translocase subunit SecB
VPTSDVPSPIPAYPIRLEAAYVLEGRIHRSTVEDPGSRDWKLDVDLKEVVLARDKTRVRVVLAAVVSVPFRERAVLTIECTMLGEFAADAARPAAELRIFGRREAVVVLWPYLRGAIGELGLMTQVPVPPLPTLDVVAFMESKNAAKATRTRRGKTRADFKKRAPARSPVGSGVAEKEVAGPTE